MIKKLGELFHNLRFEATRLIANSDYTSKVEGVSDRLPFARFIEPGIILNVDDSFTILLRCKPNDMDADTEASRDYVGLLIHKALRSLDTGWCKHFDCISRESSGYIPEDKCHFREATTYSIDFERRLEYKREGKHYEKEYVLTLTYLPQRQKINKIGAYFNNKTDEPEEQNHTINLEYFKDTIYNVVDILTSSQFKIFRMSDDEIFSYLFYCINGVHANLRVPTRHYTDLRYMLANQDIITGSYPKVGDMYLGVVSMGELFPLESTPTLLNALNSLSFEYRWSTRYIFLSDMDAKKQLSKISDFHSQAVESPTKALSKRYGDGSSGKINRSAARFAEDAEEAISAIEMSGWRYGKYTASIVVFDEKVESLAEKLKIIKGVVDNCGLFGKIERINCFEAYLGAIPAMARPNVRKWNINSLNLADLMPTSSVWSGYKKHPCQYYGEDAPVLFYASTAGSTPFRGCLHVQDDGNALVIGSNGSVVMNFLAAQQCRFKNSKVFIFDNNHASLPLTHGIANSVHYNLGYGDATESFQPLAFLDTQKDFTFAVEWLAELCEIQGFKIKPKHITIISDTLEMIRKTSSPSKRTLEYFSFHMRPTGEDMEEFSAQFSPYVSGSSLQSKIFSAKENKLTLKDFTVFEMSQLAHAGDATLIPAVLYLFHMIERNLDGSPVSIYIHDGWTIFKHPIVRDYLDDWLRKMSTNNVQIVIGVHQPSDITSSEIAGILMQSCKTKIYTANLNAKGTQKESYEELGLNETQIELIGSAITNREYYFTNQLGSRLIQFNLGELAKAFLFPPSLEDIEEIARLKEKHGDMFGYYWIKHKKLIDQIANYWLTAHNKFVQKNGLSTDNLTTQAVTKERNI